MNYPVIDLYDTAISVWEDRMDPSFRTRIFDPIIAHLRTRGWQVGVDPHIAAHYESLKETHLAASRGDLRARLEMFGRVIKFEVWQDVHGVTHPNGGRYESRRRQLMPYQLGLRFDAEAAALLLFLRTLTGYPVSDRRREDAGTADERIDRWLRGSGHYVPTLGHAKCWSDANRRAAGGVLLEHGQTVWFTDAKGRWLRGQAFYSLNNMWLVKFSPYAFTQKAAHELHAAAPPPADLRRKAGEGHARALATALKKAVAVEDFTRAAAIKRARDRQSVCAGAGTAAA